jgi:hypothetical protein
MNVPLAVNGDAIAAGYSDPVEIYLEPVNRKEISR